MKDSTVILTHAGADLDAISSMFALSRLYTGSLLIHPGSLDINATKIVSIFEDTLNFTKVKDLPDSIRDGLKRIIIADTKSYNRIGEGKELIQGKKEIIIFDHHPDTSDIAGAKIVSKRVGANTTILVDLLRKKKIMLNTFEATLISLGIFEDTGSFTFPSTTSYDFSAMSFLSSFGINMKIVHHFLSPFLGESQVKMLRRLLDGLDEYNIKGSKIAIAMGSMERYVPGLSLIAHKIIEMIDVDIIFIIAKMEKDIFLIGRSVSADYDIRNIIDKFGGGGHPTAASAVIKNMDAGEIKQLIIKIASLNYFPILKAGQIMSSPIKTVAPDTLVKEALNIMIKMGYSGLPIEENGEIVGMISKRDLEKIMLFEKRDRPVKQFSTPKIAIVSIDADLREIEDIMVKDNVGRVLVKNEHKTVGIISRSDLLKAYRIRDDMVEEPSLNSSSLLPSTEHVRSLIEFKFKGTVLAYLNNFADIAEEINQKIYIVGGAVRDLFIGSESSDFDFILSDNAVAFGELLRKRFNGKIHLYKETQTVNFMEGNYNFDFVTARREYYNEKSLIPIVEKATLQEDLKRRDFTINTLAIDITKNNFGSIYDFYGGYTDLVKRKIRVLHSYSFIEDPSRILRAIKYVVKFGFTFSEETEQMLRSALELGALKSKHSQRILDEMFELFDCEKAAESLFMMDRLGIVNQIFKLHKLSFSKRKRILIAHNFIKEFSITEKRLAYIAILLDGKKNSEKREILRFFAFNERIVNKFVTQSNILRNFHKEFEKKNKEEKFMLIKDIDDYMLSAFLTKANVREQAFIKAFLNEIRFVKIETTGNDLIAIGLKEGPQFSEIYDELLTLKIKGKLKTKEDEIEYLIKNRDKFEWK